MSITTGQDDDPNDDESGEGYVVYELHERSRETRVMLQQLLDADDIPYVWEGTDLVVPGAFERDVDALVEHADAAAEPVLPAEAEKTLYELSDWSDDDAVRLSDALAAEGILHEFDVEGNLIVLTEDEERVEEIFDEVGSPDAERQEGDEDGEDAETLDTGDGPDAQAVLTDLFVASDKLRKNANDHNGVLGLVDAAGIIEEMRLPFGFDPKVWRSIVEAAVALRDAIEDDDTPDDDIEAAADELRTRLSTLV